MSEYRTSPLPLRAGMVALAVATAVIVAVVMIVSIFRSTPDIVQAPATTVTSTYTCPLSAAAVWELVSQHRALPHCNDLSSYGGYPEAEALMP